MRARCAAIGAALVLASGAGGAVDQTTGSSAVTAVGGLVAAYAFDETGSTALDSSGNGNHGTILGARSVDGHAGRSLQFDGQEDLVTVLDSASLDLSTGMTLEAWLRPESENDAAWRTAMVKEADPVFAYALYANTDTNRPSANLFVGDDNQVAGTTQLRQNTWAHLAATWDGSMVRIYVNGIFAGSGLVVGTLEPSNGPLRIGGSALFGEFFKGRIDDVRVYNRALSGAEVLNDLRTPVGSAPPPDTTAPSAPGSLTASGGRDSVSLSWTAASDDVGVARYNVHRSTTAGFTPSAANLIGQTASTSFTNTGLVPGTYHYKVTAQDGAGNVGPASNEASALVTGDTTAPSAPASLTATGGLDRAGLSWAAATDDVGVARYNVHRSTAAGFTPSAANRIAQTAATAYTDAGLAPGTYHYRVTAEDAAGNVGPASNEASAVVTGDTTAPSVSITAPAAGATVSGTISVAASASDNVGVVGVGFLLDGQTLGAEDASAPYAVPWDTTQSAAGAHTLTAVARDGTGNTSTSFAVTVTVSNSGPAQLGQWSAPVDWPLVPVHMMLLPTRKVLLIDGFSFAPSTQREWDPATGTFTTVPYARNLFCAGHVALSDGRMLVLGGHINPYDGLADTTVYDPATHTWTRKTDMARGRWYPTATMLPDGRVLVVSGDVITQDRVGQPTPLINASNTIPEVYDPATDRWTPLTSANRWMPLYPFMFVAPDGRVVDAGPDLDTRALDLATGTWSSVLATATVDGHSAAMYAPGKILKSGTWSDPDFPGLPVDGRAAAIDLNAFAPAWREVAPMAFPRSFHTLTALPDGSVLATGGTRLSDGVSSSGAVFEAELWNPETETWTTLAAMQRPRLYHSSALLLPDGRVLVAGGGRLPSSPIVDQTNAEIYSPPYLFKGARPTISAAPSLAGYGTRFSVSTPDADRIAKVALVRLGSVTHNFDQDQRYVPLSFTAGAGSLDVQAPANGNLAPPGYYMLFIVDTNGVPSVASFVRLSAGAPADATPPTVSITAPAGGSTVSGTTSVSASASDNAGVVGVQFRLDGQNLGAEDTTAPYSVSWDTTAAANGGHTLTAVARDAAANATTSSAVAVTVDNAAPTPSPAPSGLVAAYGFGEGSGAAVADASGHGNGGTIAGATWTTAGRYGNALTFDGSDDWVSVADAPSLDLATGMTLEAWVHPTSLSWIWSTVVIKETVDGLAYALYSNNDTNTPSGHVFTGADNGTSGIAQVPFGAWTHLAATWDGATLRLYVNGTQASSRAVSGTIAVSAGPLKIGGNAVWGEYFRGDIDEVRVYGRALSAAEIQTDMSTPLP